MLKPVLDPDEIPDPSQSTRRRRRLRRIAMLPTLLTLGNLYFGFASIYFCGREMQELGAGRSAQAALTRNSVFWEHRAPSFLSIAVLLLVGSMICDALDGRVARRTGQSSKFGVQLDSLADMISFGVAPALAMITLLRRELNQWTFEPFGFDQYKQAAVLIGAIYVCCAALRLARFNVEATLEQASHEGFRGIPSPGAAGAVISLIYLHEHLDMSGGWPRTADTITKILPACTLLIALLMVSRVPYTHAVSSFLRRRPFGHVIPVVLAIPLLLLYTEQVLVITAWSFALSGIVRFLAGKTKAPPQPQESELDKSNQLESSQIKKQAT